MISITGVFPAALGAILGTACAIVQTPAAPSTEGQPAASWNVTLQLSGGFVGLDRELRIASTGELSAMDRRRKTTTIRRAGAAQIAELSALISKLSERAGTPAAPTDCRDCVRYRLQLQTGSRTINAELDDVNVAGTELESLIGALTALLNESLAG